jgi:sulfite oxidase
MRLLWQRAAVVAAAGVTSLCVKADISAHRRRFAFCDTNNKGASVYTREQVSKNDGKQTGKTWVTLGDNVYDITDFIKEHPGGAEFIKQASGGAVEPYWGYWAYHMHSKKPADALKKYWIGKVVEQHSASLPLEEVVADFYSEEPLQERSENQIQLIKYPWSSETEPKALAKSYFTKNEDFYVRNHCPVPIVDPVEFRLEINKDGNGKVLSLDDLANKFQKVSVVSVMQCAGNRASEMISIKPTAFSGTPFQDISIGMIGNALWSGYRARDVILDLFPDLKTMSNDALNEMHVHFEGIDEYSTSTPLSKILDPNSEVLFATEMNGQLLPRDHGFPLRVVIPGIAGARNIKWLYKISITRSESDSCWQGVYYKHGDAKSSIQELPLQSLIFDFEIKGKVLECKGIAWGGGSGNGIKKVEISTDKINWKEVELLPTANMKSSKIWGWTEWKTTLLLDNQPSDLWVRATDAAGNIQPEQNWNSKGYLYNGWHHIKVTSG